MKAEKLVGLQIERQRQERRVNRARDIASAGLVNRDRDRFLVSSKGLSARTSPYEVRRDESGRIRCSCLEFEETVIVNPAFRCEHILAVKFAIAAKNSEPVTKRSGAGTNKMLNATESSLPVNKKTLRKQADATAPVPFRSISDGMPGDGEQISVDTPADEAILGQNASVETGMLTAANKEGEIEMNNESSTGRPVKTEVPSDSTTMANVLAFSPAGSRVLSARPEPPFSASAGWEDCVRSLNHLTSDWTQTVRDIRQIGEFCVVTVAITVGEVTREGVGVGFVGSIDGIRTAEVLAFTEAALKFEAVSKNLSAKETGPLNRRVFPANPLAQTFSDMITPKQLGMIRGIAREIGIDAGNECYGLLFCRPDELSREAASLFIDHLSDIKSAGVASDAGARRVV